MHFFHVSQHTAFFLISTSVLVSCRHTNVSSSKVDKIEVARNRTDVFPLKGFKLNAIFNRMYTDWTPWSKCNSKCEQRRIRRCNVYSICGRRKMKEKRACRGIKRCSRTHRSRKINRSGRRNRNIHELLYNFFYNSWSRWSPCSRSCKQRRVRKCSISEVCRVSYIQEERPCSAKSSNCAKKFPKTTPSTKRKAITDDPEPTTESPSRRSTQTNKKKPRKKKQKVGQNRVPSLSSTQATCGARPDHPQRSYRVVGGKQANRLSWPWQVAIMTRYEEQYCGGVLVAPQWVLTAAHCIRKRGKKRKILVRMGEHDFQELEGTEITQKPSKDFPHPDFDYETISNDIGLVKLRRPVHRKSTVGFVCLPSENEVIAADTVCTVVGWGKLRNTHLFGSSTLQEAKVPVVHPNECRQAFEYDISDTQLCAGYKRGGIDSCAGDSGGPLLCSQTSNNLTRWFVHGVVSYGEGCGRKGKFGIYTKVTSFVKWIRDVIESN